MLTKHLLPPRLRTWLKGRLRRAGHDVVPFPRIQLLAHHGVDLLLDVGASEGLYSEEMRRLGYAGRIVSFEPRSAAYARLAQRAADDPAWDTAPYALGAERGTSVIHISGAADSSSLLDMLPEPPQTYPDIGYVGEETIEVRTLDDAFATHHRSGEVPFLKMDVQGYERHVLEGGARTLARLAGIQMELSLVPIYEGETLFTDMVHLLEARGFTLMGLEPGLRDPASRQLLQVDGLFFRTP